MAQSDARRLLPIVARAFAELGYRRATTAKLARACGVRENVIYRVWPSKKAMFLASIDYIWDSSRQVWQDLLERSRDADPAEATRRVLQYESTRHGKTGLYRVVFAGLSETDDPEIAAAMRRMYGNFHTFIAAQVAASRRQSQKQSQKQSGDKTRSKTAAGGSGGVSLEDEVAAWALVGLATVASIGQSLGLPNKRQRSLLYTHVGNLLIEAKETPLKERVGRRTSIGVDGSLKPSLVGRHFRR
jgi:AcrR family transcriptional regulator